MFLIFILYFHFYELRKYHFEDLDPWNLTSFTIDEWNKVYRVNIQHSSSNWQICITWGHIKYTSMVLSQTHTVMDFDYIERYKFNYFTIKAILLSPKWNEIF